MQSDNVVQLIVAIIGAGGLTAAIPALIKGIRDHRSGKHAAEKERNTSALAQRDEAIRDRDAADEWRIAWSNYAGDLTFLLKQHGIDVPEAPKRPARATD